ncbi:MAG: hypothetical protein ABMA64_35655 [Myxococcota bacterium]
MIAALWSADAFACSCLGSGSFSLVSPADGSVGVPTNTRITWLGLGAEGGGEEVEQVQVALDPPPAVEPRWTVEDHSVGGDGAVFLVFDEPLPAHTEVAVLDGDSLAPWVTFTTGSGPDREPPTVGRVQVDTSVKDWSCSPPDSPWVSHAFHLEGLSDDATPTRDLVVHLAPRRVGRDVWGLGQTTFATYSVCGGDPTLGTDRHRTYDLEVFDASGNPSDERRVSTRGCTSAPGPLGLAWAAVALLGRRGRARG